MRKIKKSDMVILAILVLLVVLLIFLVFKAVNSRRTNSITPEPTNNIGEAVVRTPNESPTDKPMILTPAYTPSATQKPAIIYAEPPTVETQETQETQEAQVLTPPTALTGNADIDAIITATRKKYPKEIEPYFDGSTVKKVIWDPESAWNGKTILIYRSHSEEGFAETKASKVTGAYYTRTVDASVISAGRELAAKLLKEGEQGYHPIKKLT